VNQTPSIPARGRVVIAGAGPGDPELLTLKVLRRLQEADALVHDALVPAEILELAAPGCARYDAGKRGGQENSARQDDINALLADLARQGLNTVRLKGGDPFVFGRGGEEAIYLRERGIPVEIIPGVSSVNGATAAAGIPLTHRHVSARYTVLEGYASHLDRIDWAALVALGGTWVFLMAKATARDIAGHLLRHGAPADLPAALIEQGTWDRQCVQVLPLAEVSRGALHPRTEGPGLFLVGATAALRDAIASPSTFWEHHEVALSDLSQTGPASGLDRRWR
jgi:uroporphyrin-III C-methyltransferase